MSDTGLLQVVMESVACSIAGTQRVAFESGDATGPAILQLAVGRLLPDAADDTLAIVAEGGRWDSLKPAWTVRQMRMRVLFTPKRPTTVDVVGTAVDAGFDVVLLAALPTSAGTESPVDDAEIGLAFGEVTVKTPLRSPRIVEELGPNTNDQWTRRWQQVLWWLNDPEGPWRPLVGGTQSAT